MIDLRCQERNRRIAHVNIFHGNVAFDPLGPASMLGCEIRE
jgi:hypothetical protein